MNAQPKLGLALSGGGVRGLAHVGVLRVLEREGIIPYCVSGASMGAIVGALYAAGKHVYEIEEIAAEAVSLTQMFKLADLTYPWRGLLAGHNAAKYLEDRVGADLRFEDCPIKLGVSAVDLIERTLVHITTGKVVPAVRGSLSLVGVFTPYAHNGRRLVDGGYLDNLPVGLARDLGADVVVAVDVGAEYPYTSGDDNGNPVDSRLPGITPPVVQDLLQLNTMMVQELVRLRLEMARPDVILRPALPSAVGVLTGFDLIPEIYAAGEQAAEDALPRIRELLERAQVQAGDATGGVEASDRNPQAHNGRWNDQCSSAS